MEPRRAPACLSKPWLSGLGPRAASHGEGRSPSLKWCPWQPQYSGSGEPSWCQPRREAGAQAGCPRLRLARTGGVHSPCWWLMPRLPWGRILPTALGAEGPGRLGSHSVLPRGVRGAGAQALNIPWVWVRVLALPLTGHMIWGTSPDRCLPQGLAPRRCLINSFKNIYYMPTMCRASLVAQW